MFDEVDEGTAIFKVTSEPPTQAHFVGYEGLPSDWYLRLTGEGAGCCANSGRWRPKFRCSRNTSAAESQSAATALTARRQACFAMTSLRSVCGTSTMRLPSRRRPAHATGARSRQGNSDRLLDAHQESSLARGHTNLFPKFCHRCLYCDFFGLHSRSFVFALLGVPLLDAIVRRHTVQSERQPGFRACESTIRH